MLTQPLRLLCQCPARAKGKKRTQRRLRVVWNMHDSCQLRLIHLAHVSGVCEKLHTMAARLLDGHGWMMIDHLYFRGCCDCCYEFFLRTNAYTTSASSNRCLVWSRGILITRAISSNGHGCSVDGFKNRARLTQDVPSSGPDLEPFFICSLMGFLQVQVV